MAARTPWGFRDILPAEALVREGIRAQVAELFSSRGYLPVETPLLEERPELERGGRIRSSPFQLIDADGSLMVLRPDLTLPIARLVSARVPDGGLPLRLRYAAPLVREESELGGRPRQLTQLGVELFDLEGACPELELVLLLAEVLDALGVPAWHVACGSVRPLQALLARRSPSEEVTARVLELVHASDLVGLDEYLDGLALEPSLDRALRELPRLTGDASVVARVDELLAAAEVPEGERGTGELVAMAEGLHELLGSGQVAFDFSIPNSFDYYTGVVFRCYSELASDALASGGRYDAVLRNLGRPNVLACGFALSLEALQEVLGQRGGLGGVASVSSRAERPLRIAVPKGSLFAPTVRMLEAAGLPVGELREPGRRLVIPADGVEYVIVRAQDAPTFVGNGGADCGICGNDSIIEAGEELVQLVGLGYGACRFVVAEPASRRGAAEEAYGWRGSVRVATKYPRITRRYYESIGQQVDIVQLHGNIELGPIVGMSDRIVDITATGETLAQNDLVVVNEVMECAARFFAGPAAYRSDSRVRALARKLLEVSASGEGSSR